MQGMHTDADGVDQLTRSIIGSAFAVANGLGADFFEKVYENALVNKIRDAAFAARSATRGRCAVQGTG